jgi:RNA polymerase sigma factor (sigma-70 family)
LRIPDTGGTEANEQISALMSAESDAGLLTLMSQRTQDEAWADAAFCEFYARHKNYIWIVCVEIASTLNGDAWIEDIFDETFERAYQKAGSFKLPSGATPESESRLVRGWLGKIAANLLRTLLRNHRNEYAQDEETWDKLADTVGNSTDDGNQTSSVSPKQKLIDDALETLSEREALVVRVTFQYYRVGEKFQRLPNKIVQELAESLGTTPENLRKIRERALRQIRDYVAEHSGGIVNKPITNEPTYRSQAAQG